MTMVMNGQALRLVASDPIHNNCSGTLKFKSERYETTSARVTHITAGGRSGCGGTAFLSELIHKMLHSDVTILLLPYS